MKQWISELKCGDAEQSVLLGKRTLDGYRTSKPEALDAIAACKTRGVFITGLELGMDMADRLSRKGVEVIRPVIDASRLNSIPRHRVVHQFCATMIGALNQHVMEASMRDGWRASGSHYQETEYFDSLRQVSEALQGAQEAPGSKGIDAIYAWQHALDLGSQLHRHFGLVSKMLFNGSPLCFLVDGMEFAISNGWPILESMRRNLASPYAVGIVHAGDTALEAISTAGPAVAPDNDGRSTDDGMEDDWR